MYIFITPGTDSCTKLHFPVLVEKNHTLYVAYITLDVFLKKNKKKTCMDDLCFKIENTLLSWRQHNKQGE